MSMQKAVFFGAAKSGKTALIRRIAQPNSTFFETNDSTYRSELQILSLANGDTLQLWDLAGNDETAHNDLMQSAMVGFYCVSLAKPINKKAIARDLARFKKANSAAPLILVGTHKDAATADRLAAFDALNNDFLSTAILPFSAKTDSDCEPFWTCLHTGLAQFHAGSEKPVIPDADGMRRMDEALAMLPADSPLYPQLTLLYVQLLAVSKEKRQSIGDEVYDLLVNLENPAVGDKMEAINQFEMNCKPHLYYSTGLKEIGLIAAIILVTITAATLALLAGFLLGFALGLWAGPMAFLIAYGTGTSLIAQGVVGASPAIGMIAGGVASYCLFFQPSRQARAVQELAECAREQVGCAGPPISMLTSLS